MLPARRGVGEYFLAAVGVVDLVAYPVAVERHRADGFVARDGVSDGEFAAADARPDGGAVGPARRFGFDADGAVAEADVAAGDGGGVGSSGQLPVRLRPLTAA